MKNTQYKHRVSPRVSKKWFLSTFTTGMVCVFFFLKKSSINVKALVHIPTEHPKILMNEENFRSNSIINAISFLVNITAVVKYSETCCCYYLFYYFTDLFGYGHLA